MLFVITLSIACDDDNAHDEKGSEEQALSEDGKSDSFFKPTEHGDITFGLPSEGVVKEGEIFHAFNFKLSEEAEVTLKTEVSQNLDTVMYLYRRDTPTDTWGSFIEKNDDHAGNIWSQIKFDGVAAEYRVIVKPFKKALRGTFSLNASCIGAGCVSENRNQCETGTFTAPEGEGFTDSCAIKIMDVVSTPQISTSRGSIPFDKHCDLEGIEQLAVLHYTNYFQDLGVASLEELFDFGSGINYEFEHISFEGGHQVNIDAGGDENGATLIYDSASNLLVLYQHNQTPDIRFHCGESGDTTLQTEPFAECILPVLTETPKTTDTPERMLSGTKTLELIEDESIIGVGDLTRDFFDAYRDILEADSKIKYDYAEYTSSSSSVGILVLSFGSNASITYTAYNQTDGVMYVRSENENTSFSCEQ